tara:strand:- start:57 stop:710 length:654 start_codon:yes stop_codon:yes gene_type:complete
MSTKKVKQVAIDIAKMSKALDNYFGAVDKENKAHMTTKEMANMITKIANFEWFNHSLDKLKGVCPEMVQLFSEKVFNIYSDMHPEILHFNINGAQGDIDYHFVAEDYITLKAQALKEKYPNAEGYAYLNDAKTGTKRQFKKFEVHQFNALKELAQPEQDKEKVEKVSRDRDTLTIEALYREIGKYNNTKDMSQSDAKVRISAIEKAISTIQALQNNS